MGNKKNRILLILMIVLSFVGIIWQLFSFMGIGLIYKYDLCKIPYNIIMDKIIWNSLKISYILNSSFLLISLFFRSHIKRKDIRRILYLIAIGATVLFVLFWEYNYMKLLIELPSIVINCLTICEEEAITLTQLGQSSYIYFYCG